jgi:hypothetical protein
MKRLNAMSVGIKAALAGPDKARVHGLFVSVNSLIKSNDFVQASTALEELEKLVASSAAPPAPPAPQGGAELMKRLNAMSPGIKVALVGPDKARVQALFVSVNGLIKNKDFVKAKTALDELETLVAKSTGAPTVAPAGGLSVMKLGKARLEWNDVRLKAMKELERFKQILQDEYRDQPKQQAALSAAMKRLDATNGKLTEELGTQLDEVLNADMTQRPQTVTAAKNVLARFVKFIESDDLMSVIDGNEYAPDMLVAAPLQGKLKEIEAALA